VVLLLFLSLLVADTLLLLISTMTITFAFTTLNVRKSYSLLKDPKKLSLMLPGPRRLMTSDLLLLVPRKSNSGTLLM